MEKQSPADCSSPSSVSGRSSNTPATTYTTAGTIYNPNSTQPLQPPTRRGRSHKWTSGGVYPDLSLLPRSMLTSIQSKSVTGRSSPYPATQYTRLQQNYDRAANPNKSDYMPDMPSSWGTSSSPVLEPDLSSLNAMVADQDVDSDEEDDEAINNIMMNMTVKSLHNLASYPNPNQKKAQKALIRPVKPRLNGHIQNSSVSNLPPPQASWEAKHSPDMLYDGGWAKPRHCNSDSVAAHMMARAELQNIARKGHGDGTSPVQSTDGDQGAVAWTAQLALGAPRPLTAGPPGQRQYRASTFKSTFKALGTDTTRTKYADDEDAYAVTARVLQHAGIDDAGGKLENSLTRQDSEKADYKKLFQGSQMLHGSSSNKTYGYVGSPEKKPIEGREHNGAVKSPTGLVRPEWGRSLPWNAERCYGKPEYEASYQAYMDSINKIWYGGCQRLCGENGEASDKAGAYVGVISDGRPRSFNRHGELKLQEANKMDASEHAKPLLEMAMANLERRLVELELSAKARIQQQQQQQQQ